MFGAGLGGESGPELGESFESSERVPGVIRVLERARGGAGATKTSKKKRLFPAPNQGEEKEREREESE